MMPFGGNVKYIIAVALSCVGVSYAADFKINASQTVTGTLQPIDWNQEAIAAENTRRTLFPTYQSSTVSSVWQDEIPLFFLGGAFNVYRPTYYGGSPWPPQQNVALQEPYAGSSQMATTSSVSGNWKTTYSNPYVVRAAVNFPAPANVEARVSNGSANADFNYRMTTTNGSGVARDYFLTFLTPQLGRTVAIPYSLSSSSDSNGGTYSYINPPSASSRSAFDVYVDGLPVFSDANYYDHNAAYQDAFGSETFNFGLQAPLPSVLIYLGKIPSGGNLTVDVVMRAEATANSPNCGTTQYMGFQPPYDLQKNCFDLDETISIPANNPSVAMSVFSLVLN
jgi:hypothetical protein